MSEWEHPGKSEKGLSQSIRCWGSSRKKAGVKARFAGGARVAAEATFPSPHLAFLGEEADQG